MNQQIPCGISPVAMTFFNLRPYVVRQQIIINGILKDGSTFAGELASIDWNDQQFEIVSDGFGRTISINDVVTVNYNQLNFFVPQPVH